MVKKSFSPAPYNNLLARVEEYLTRYVTFASPDYAFAGALWAAGTYIWPHVDAFPYLVITADTKRSGKTRFAEVLSYVSSNPRMTAGTTPAAMYMMIRDIKPTLFIDEAEALSAEGASMIRTVLNVGYRKGQTIPRANKGGGVEDWPAYCPKAFILIGDVFDTLKDRSIIIRMQRATPRERFTFAVAQPMGNALGTELKDAMEMEQLALIDAYAKHEGLPFLPDRDEEIWLALFAVCAVLAPDRLEELKRVAVDLATEKTQESRRYVNLQGAEDAAADDEYARRLLADLLTVMGNAKGVASGEALTKLHELVTGPWRKFRGSGLTQIDMGNLLARFAVKPKVIRFGSGRANSKTLRGYAREDVAKALKSL